MYNKQQLEAINTLDGRVRIIAGAGSGKTATLTQRYIKLLETQDPYNILCVTFTNKAANEMKTRIENKVGELKNSLICTFHSFCLRVLRQSIGKLGYPSNFIILDTTDQKAIVKKLFKEGNVDKEQIKPKTALELIHEIKLTKEKNLLDLLKKDDTITKLYENAKNEFNRCKHLNYNSIQQVLTDYLYYGYLYYEQTNTGLDFNDLIIICVTLFKQHEDVLKKWQHRLKYIMVDEFQDASFRQYELVTMLSAEHGNLFVVGDPDQTIYSWRGAKPEILVNFDKQGDTKTIILNQNYRSTPNILNIANELIENNTLRVEKDLFTENQEGTKPFFYYCNTYKEECMYVADLIKKALVKYSPKDIVILYRQHSLSRGVEEQLIKHSIPYVIYSSINFYERKEIKDILCYLRLINNTKDDLAFERIINVPKRGIGDKKVQSIKEYAKLNNCSLFKAASEMIKTDNIKQLEDFIFMINLLHAELRVPDFNLVNFVQKVIQLSGYTKIINSEFEKETKENVMQLISSMAEYEIGTSLDQYLQEIALLTNTDAEQRNAVSLMTIHASKGLEFPIVFVIGLEEGTFPSEYCAEGLEMEEERRLAYVAITRAKKFLFLMSCKDYMYGGCDLKESRFIQEIDTQKLQTINTTEKKEQTYYEPKKISRKAWVVKRR